MDFEKLKKNLEKHGFAAAHFARGEEAADYVAGQLSGREIGIGGSMTVGQIGLYDKLKKNNTVHWHLQDGITDENMLAACGSEIYITGANAVSESGTVLNIDGRGNRLAGTLLKKKKVFFIVGSNKIAPDTEAALERARNVAAPKNTARLGCKTPCAVTGHCYDCASPERICSALLVLWQKPFWAEEMEVVVVDEELGF